MARGLAASLVLILCGPSLHWDGRPWATAISSPPAGKAPFVALLFQDGENSEIESLLGDPQFTFAVERCALVAAGRHLHQRPDGVKMCPILETTTCEAHAKNWFPAYQTLAEDGVLTTPQLVVFDHTGRVLARWKQSFDVGSKAGIGAAVAAIVTAYRGNQARESLEAARAHLKGEAWDAAWRGFALTEDTWPETEHAGLARRDRAALEKRRDLVDVIRPLVRDREAHALWKRALEEEVGGKVGRARTIWKQLVRKYGETTWSLKAAARLEAEKRR